MALELRVAGLAVNSGSFVTVGLTGVAGVAACESTAVVESADVDDAGVEGRVIETAAAEAAEAVVVESATAQGR